MNASFFPDFIQQYRGHGGLGNAVLVCDGLLGTTGIQRADCPGDIHREFASVGKLSVEDAGNSDQMGRIEASSISARVMDFMSLRDRPDVAFVRPAVERDGGSLNPCSSVPVASRGAMPLPAPGYLIYSIKVGIGRVPLTCTRSMVCDKPRATTRPAYTDWLPTPARTKCWGGRGFDLLSRLTGLASSGMAVDRRAAVNAIVGTINAHVTAFRDVPRRRVSSAPLRLSVLSEQLYQTGGAPCL